MLQKGVKICNHGKMKVFPITIKIYAEDEPQLAVQYGIKQAPTLLTVKGGEAERYVNLSNIRKYIGV